jgi:hypothetical protein
MLSTAWCDRMGISGWLAMAVLWGTFIALVAWAITRMFPLTPSTSELAVPAYVDRSDSSRAAVEPPAQPDPRAVDLTSSAATSHPPTRTHRERTRS